MNISSIVKTVEKFTIDNSPSILTAMGVVGTVSTAVLTGKASFKAADLIQDEYNERIGAAGSLNADYEIMLPKEKFQLVWKLYIPAASTGVLTIVVIVGANRIGSRRAAAVAAAYSISQEMFSEYREKIVDKMGPKQEQAARDEIAQERVNKHPVGREVIITSDRDVLFMEGWTNRYFYSTMEDVKAAQNKINYLINHQMYASLTDLYNELGLTPTTDSDEVGWNSDKPLEIMFSTTVSDDKKPCFVINYDIKPIRDYDRFR